MQKQDWQSKKEVIKGNIGEKIVNEYLEKRGYVVYEPITNKAHHFDKVISKDKKFLAIAEVKTYEKLKYYPETGIDLKNYLEYLNIKNIEVFIFFVDYLAKSIYGNKLSVLNKSIEIEVKGKLKKYPYVMSSATGKKQMFHLDSMIEISKLTDEQCEILKNKTNISY